MKINRIIREKRKELSLTQEQIADFLGVSTPAVNKWEKGSTYPDITLLPALARLLKIDLNTLMSFHDDLTDIEIENFVNEVGKTVQEQDYDTAFQKAINKIHEYPTCEKLIYSVILYLEGVLALYNVSEIEEIFQRQRS
ncbi:MAG: helix-turn-helix transcriptional regulator [Lachnospiraceae bacterium]|nr:helix-turn-helix transcriptional regulator [Lachnospiraceae bacterium]